MPQTARQLMSVDEFLVWQRDQEERYELVDGEPRMMTGASTVHDRIVVNVIRELGNQLKGTRCTPTTADVGLRTRIRSLRRPDVTVMCDDPRSDAYEARDARVVVEVLSPSNRGVGWHRKIEEYRSHEGLGHILLIDGDAPLATLLTRAGDTWSSQDIDGRDRTIDLTAVGCTLPMAEVYAGIDWPAA